MKKITALAVLLLSLSSLPALAVPAAVSPSPASKNNVCYIYGQFQNQAKSNAALAGSGMDACGLEMKNPVTNVVYDGFRLEPMANVASTPINLPEYNVCIYLTNTSSNSYFIPAKTGKDWTAFLTRVANGQLPGVGYTFCTKPQTVASVDLCGGKMFTSTTQDYSQGFTGLGWGRAGVDKLQYYVMDSDHNLLRVVTAVATANGWSVSYSNACPDPSAKGKGAVAASLTTPVFNRADNTATTDRIMITDGAILRNIQ